MLRVWRMFRPQAGQIFSENMGVHLPVLGHLPDAGGTLDQAAIMLDAFAVMDAAEARILRAKRQA